MIAFNIPYPLLLGLLVAILDLIPVIGSTIGGFIVTLVALTVSLPTAVATLAFYIAYRLAEDYLIVPRIMGRTVEVPGRRQPGGRADRRPCCWESSARSSPSRWRRRSGSS